MICAYISKGFETLEPWRYSSSLSSWRHLITFQRVRTQEPSPFLPEEDLLILGESSRFPSLRRREEQCAYKPVDSYFRVSYLQYRPPKGVRWQQSGPHHLTTEGETLEQRKQIWLSLLGIISPHPGNPSSTFRTTQINTGVEKLPRCVHSGPALATIRIKSRPPYRFQPKLQCKSLPDVSAVSSPTPQTPQLALWTTSWFCR